MRYCYPCLITRKVYVRAEVGHSCIAQDPCPRCDSVRVATIVEMDERGSLTEVHCNVCRRAHAAALRDALEGSE